jgi:hypothetical protein
MKKCIDCKYFQNNKGGICTKTKRFNPVNGKLEYQQAITVRYDEKQCGLEGKDHDQLVLPIMADFFDDFD